MKGLRFDEIISVFDVIFPLVTTDLTNNELVSLTYTIFLMDTDNIGTYRIPSDDSFTSAKIRGMSVLVPDLSENRKVLKTDSS